MAEQRPSAIGGALKRPFTEQVAFFRQKLGNLVPTRRWDDMLGAEHDRAFMVAGAMKADLLSDLTAAIDRAIAEGQGLETFRKDFRAIVERHGWHGWTGEGTRGGEAWRTRTIYRTNAASSYAAGRLAQLEEGDFPLWVYRHGGSKEPRPQHLDWNGLMLPADHVFWETHYPPSDWGCSCYVLGARSERGARRLGGDPAKSLPEGWDSRDPRTGEPPGIGRGWGYAPGGSVAQTVAAAARKVGQWDYTIAKAFMEAVPEAQRDALARSYRGLPSTADDARRYAERVLGERGGAPVRDVEIQPYRTLGLLTSDQARQVARVRGLDVAGYDFAVGAQAIRHVAREHGNARVEAARRQRAVTAEDYARLPALVDAPDALRRGDTDNRVVLSRRIGGEEYVSVWERLPRRRMMALVSLWIREGSGS